MTKESPDERGQGAVTPLGPTDEQRAASRAFAARFDRLREEADELLKLYRVATQAFATRPAAQFEGLCRVFDTLLPRDDDSQRRIARAVEVDLTTLQRLRANRIDPFDAPPAPLATLSRAMTMDFATFWLLAQRDHERVAARGGGSKARGSAVSDTHAVLTAFRDAWERDARDDPPHGELVTI